MRARKLLMQNLMQGSLKPGNGMANYTELLRVSNDSIIDLRTFAIDPIRNSMESATGDNADETSIMSENSWPR